MADSHYFSSTADVASARQRITVAVGGLTFVMETDRGVFSHGHVDTGTKLLMIEAPTPPATGTFLDLGCGAGPLALALALRSPDAEVWAVDVNERAVALTSANAERLALPGIRAALWHEVPPDTRFDLIWSNPPIRIGKQALHEMLSHWLARLNTNGEAILVVQQHLGADSLAKWIESEGYEVSRLASRAGFRLLRAIPRT